MPLVFCPECGSQLSRKDAICPGCGSPGYATIFNTLGVQDRERLLLAEDRSELLKAVAKQRKVRKRLKARIKKASAWKKKRRWYFSLFIGVCEKTAVGALLVGLFQDNAGAFWLALYFLAASLLLTILASK